MKRDLALTSFASGIVVGVAVAMLAVGIFATGIFHTQEAAAQAAPAAQGQAAPPAQGGGAGGGRGQRGPAAPPAPCGPNIAGDLGANTAKDSRCFELRMYTVDKSRVGQGNFRGGITELHKRFREGEVEVFKQSGVEVLATWQDLGEPDTLVYLLAYKDRAARDAGWAKFNADPKWTELRNKYFVPLTTKVFMMSATDYSPLK
jgi:NIPSNAP protein